MPDFTWSPKAPLERIKGVSRKANQALRDYALMGVGRSLRKLAKITSWSLSDLVKWSGNCRWQERVRNYDDIQQKQALEAYKVERYALMYDFSSEKAILASIDPAEFMFEDWIDFLDWYYFGKGRLVDFILRVRSTREVSDKVRKTVFERDSYICQYCGSKEKMTIDHIFPRSRGGRGYSDNLVACCSHCNSVKHNRTPEEAGMMLRAV